MKDSKNYGLHFLLPAIFTLPYLILFKYFKFSADLSIAEIGWALKNSCYQSAGAALLVTILSIPMSQGVFCLSSRGQRFFEKALMLPQIFPALYSILIVFSLVQPFPMGTYGTILVFSVINLGFATLLTYWATQTRLAGLAVISEVYSLGRFRFFQRIYLPLISSDLLTVFFTVFMFCFSSFSVPLIVGGGRGANIEVLIYEKIFIEQSWSAAVWLSLLQTFFIFILSVMIFKNSREKSETFMSGRYLKSWFGLLLVVGYLLMYGGGYVSGVRDALKYTPFMLMYIWDLGAAAIFTLKAALVFIAVNYVLLLIWVFDFLRRGRFNLATHLISISTVVTGFAFYLLFPVSARYDLVKIVTGASLLLFPALFKFFLQRPIENLRPQIEVARLYGISDFNIMIEIIFRQIHGHLYAWASFLVLWIAGDYAVVRALGLQTQTLGMLSAGFLGSFRLPMSYLMSFYILIFWLATMGLVYLTVKVGYVLYKKLIL